MQKYFGGNSTESGIMEEYNGEELIIMACSNCNIKCSHCYISYKGNREAEELLQMVRSLKNRYRININGAEVLTNVDYLKSYQEIEQNYILTNGKIFLTDKNICQKLKYHGIDSISLSYHFGIHNDISPVKQEDLNNIINIIQNNGLQFRLMTTITTDNYKNISYMCEQAKTLGARGIKFTNYLRQGNGINLDKKLILSQKQIDEFFTLLMTEREKYDIEDLLIERCGTFGKNFLSNHDHFACDSIVNSVVLTPDNCVYPCIFLAKPGHEIGRYVDGKILINNNYKNNSQLCLARNICNGKQKCLKR